MKKVFLIIVILFSNITIAIQVHDTIISTIENTAKIKSVF